MDHKRGDTFDFSGQAQILDASGNTVDLTGWSIASAIKTVGRTTVTNLNAVWLDDSAGLLRIYATDTSGWALGAAILDVQFTSPSGDIVSTKTVTINIIEDVTP